MDVSQYVLLGAVIAGATELLNRLRARDFWVAATIVTSAVIGTLFGAADVEGLTPITGLAAGLGASGAIKVLSAFGQKSPAVESKVIGEKRS